MWVPGGFSSGRRAPPWAGPAVRGTQVKGFLEDLALRGRELQGQPRVRTAGSGNKNTSSHRTYKWAGSASSTERPGEGRSHLWGGPCRLRGSLQ